jgi:hypothetical protein
VKSVPAPARPLTIVLEDRSASPDEHEYFTFVHEALATHPGVKAVVVGPAIPADVVPDATVAIRPRSAYHGSWWNYPITFPGFVFFTHAWNGFVYSADLDTEVEVRADGRPATTRAIDTRYRMRHCNFKRGALTSSGWYTPGWGGLNAVIGFFMVRYDTASTPAFQKEVRSAYGSYVANSIVEILNGAAAGHEKPDGGDTLLRNSGLRCG